MTFVTACDLGGVAVLDRLIKFVQSGRQLGERSA
jgi:hypothetical protein